MRDSSSSQHSSFAGRFERVALLTERGLTRPNLQPSRESGHVDIEYRGLALELGTSPLVQLCVFRHVSFSLARSREHHARLHVITQHRLNFLCTKPLEQTGDNSGYGNNFPHLVSIRAMSIYSRIFSKMDDPEKEAKGVDDEQVLVVRDSSYPLSRFSAKYLSQIIRKDVSDKRVFLRSLPIPRIEILYHELGFGKESALDGTLPDHVRRNAFRSALKMFRKNIFTGGTQLPTQIADWHSSTCLLKFEGFASEFLDRHGAQFWGDEDSNEDRNGITIAKHQDL